MRPNPGGEIPPGVYESLIPKLEACSRVHFMGMISRSELLDHYSKAHVAVDLMQRNPKRELAFTTRTVEYLWCGLVPIYNNYSDLSEPIRQYRAGWIIDPNDTATMDSTISTILNEPEILNPMMSAAQMLAREKFNWEVQGRKLLEMYDRL